VDIYAGSDIWLIILNVITVMDLILMTEYGNENETLCSIIESNIGIEFTSISMLDFSPSLRKLAYQVVQAIRCNLKNNGINDS
jgi:hypothetical protein